MWFHVVGWAKSKFKLGAEGLKPFGALVEGVQEGVEAVLGDIPDEECCCGLVFASAVSCLVYFR